MFICLSSPTVFVRRSIKANDRSQPIYALVQVMNTSCADAFMLKPKNLRFDIKIRRFIQDIWYSMLADHDHMLLWPVL